MLKTEKKKDIVYVANNSNGKDSLFMILSLIEKKYPLDYVVFFDTGKEFDAIYEIWNKLKILLDENNIKYFVLYPTYDFDYSFSEKVINTRDGSFKKGYSWCGGVCRWMTTYKIQTIHDFYKKNFSDSFIVEYIGYASDELDRVKIPYSRGNIVQKYPLIEWGFEEKDCLLGCYERGFYWFEPNTNIDLYSILDRVSCWCCSNKNLNELRNIYMYLPNYWEKLKRMQDLTDKPFKSYGSIYDLEERFKNELEDDK